MITGAGRGLGRAFAEEAVKNGDQVIATVRKNPMQEYEGSAVHATRSFLAENNHKQEGDPAKAAAFLYGIVDSGKLPMRLLIGKKCCDDVRAALHSHIEDIDSYYAESSQTDFEE